MQTNLEVISHILILCCLTSTIMSIGKMQKQYQSNLKFGTFIGQCVSQSQIASFKTAVNQAVILFGDNLQKNVQYITSEFNQIEGSEAENYFVLIQQYEQTKDGWAIYNVEGCNVAEFRNINELKPAWSYMFIRIFLYKDAVYNFIQYQGKGSGITSQLQTFIFNLVMKTEVTSPCRCKEAYDIQSDIQKFDHQEWSLICDDSYDVNAYISAKNDQWIYTKLKECYYLIYVA